jgi:hypothetical protein
MQHVVVMLSVLIDCHDLSIALELLQRVEGLDGRANQIIARNCAGSSTQAVSQDIALKEAHEEAQQAEDAILRDKGHSCPRCDLKTAKSVKYSTRWY